MRLLNEETEHHLPDAPKEQPALYVRLARRTLAWLVSVKGRTVSIGILLILALTGILSLSYLDASRNVDENGNSLRDFQAEFQIEVEDTEATSRKIDRARQSVPVIYQPEQEHNRDIMGNLEGFLGDIGVMATDAKLSASEKQRRFIQLVNSHPQSGAIFDKYFRKAHSREGWDILSLVTLRTMQKILGDGVTENDAQQNRDQIIRKALPRYGMGRENAGLVYFLIDSTLEPNHVVDTAAMEKAQEQAIENIKPVMRTFEEGQTIVHKGEQLTPLHVAALKKMGKVVNESNWVACLGILLLSTLFVFTLWSYLYTFKDGYFFKPSYAALIGTLVLTTIGLFQIMEQSGSMPIYFFFPLGTFALTLSIFMHPRYGVLATCLLAFLIGLTLKADFYSLSSLLFGSMMGIYILSKRINFNDRGQLIYAGLFIGATNALLFAATMPLNPQMTSKPLEYSGVMFGLTFVLGIVSGVITIGSLFILESIFRLVTPYKLAELGNHDQPLLKRMQFEAPGTFHHSLMVATLAEAAAEAIGANALLTRVGCLYHDIGKMKRPLFFIENQAYFGSENPHDKLTPRLSKMVITAHPRDSLEMAKQHNLPEVLMKFMTEHHGTLTAGYFYNKACIEEGVENVNKSQFRYPGPKPNIKETAIVMLADACESAVRALKNPTVAQVEERIDKIIQQRVEDGQFDNCPITFQDIHKVKETFVRVLRGIQHNRIEYQQNMMRELGRKLPASASAETANIQEALQHIQDKPGEGGSHQGPPSGTSSKEA